MRLLQWLVGRLIWLLAWNVAVDFEDADDIGFEPIPRGRYKVEVVDASQEGPGPSGSYYIAVQFRIIDDEEYDNRRLFHNFSLSKKIVKRFQQFLIATGWKKEDLESQVDIDLEDLLEVECVVSVKIELSEDYGARNAITNFFPVDD